MTIDPTPIDTTNPTSGSLAYSSFIRSQFLAVKTCFNQAKTDLLNFFNGAGTALTVSGYDDATASIIVKGTGVNDPTWATIAGNDFGFGFSASTMNQCWAGIHITHSYKPGGNVFLHIHWQTIASPTIGIVRWGFEYWIAKGHQQGVLSKFSTQTGTVYVEQSTDGLSEHYIAEIGLALPITNIEPDTVIKVRIFRDAAHVNDTYTGIAYGINIDAHFEVDRICTKNKEPNFYV